MTPTFHAFIKFLSKELTSVASEPDSEAQHILCFHGNYTNAELLISLNDEVPQEIMDKCIETVEVRKQNKPLAYILNEIDFLTETYKVLEGVLIPRPETELIVETAKTHLSKLTQQGKQIDFFELGYGTGIISISCHQAYPGLNAQAWDINPEAYKNAVLNSQLKDINTIKWHLKDFFQDEEIWLKSCCADTPTILISNPPYIPSAEINTLDASVKGFEPKSALDGGEEGIDFYERIFKKLGQAKQTTLIFEIGIHQKPLLEKSIQRHLSEVEVTFINDFQNIPRCLTIKIS